MAFFERATCPDGWSALTEVQGRAIVGLTPGGTLLGSVGAPLGNLEDRTHSHVVPSATLMTGVAPAHGHTINPPSTATSTVATVKAPIIGSFDASREITSGETHGHTYDAPLFSSGAAGEHSHELTVPEATTGVVGVGQVMPYVQLLACRNGSTSPTLPVGATVFFTSPGCPGGWSELTSARGRTVVAMRSGGTIGGTVGAGLSDLEDRSHLHTIGAVGLDTKDVPAHTHLIDPPMSRTGQFVATSALIHGGTGQRYILNASVHDHTVNIPAFQSSSAGAHGHGISIGQTQTTAARTGRVMPYLALVACRNDSPASSVPARGTTFFSAATCPAGWSELVAARGRAVVGLVPGGTVGGTVGDPLGDGENRPHVHATAPFTLNTSSHPHRHLVNPPATDTSAFQHTSLAVEFFLDVSWYVEQGASHQHTVDIGAFFSQEVEHAHPVTFTVRPTSTVHTGNIVPYVQLLACAKA